MKYQELSWNDEVCRINAKSNPGFGSTNPCVLNPWNVLNVITQGPAFSQRIGRRIFINKIVYRFTVTGNSNVC